MKLIEWDPDDLSAPAVIALKADLRMAPGRLFERVWVSGDEKIDELYALAWDRFKYCVEGPEITRTTVLLMIDNASLIGEVAYPV